MRLMALLMWVGPGVLLWAGCGGNQSSLNPAAQESQSISNLWWFFCIVLLVIYVVVLIVAAMALLRRRRQKQTEPILVPEEGTERRMRVVVSGAVGVTVVVLFVLLICDFATGRTINTPADLQPVKIKVTGHQWWWEIQYQDPTPSQMVTTANEIHVPVGKLVEFLLQSTDVIHSFWAPNFNGKKDLVPGHPTTISFKAQKAGTYGGQCAEFCGAQHAHMRFVIMLQPQAEFNSWLSSQRASAAEPADGNQERGKQVFLTSSCVMCHTIDGTPARGRVGPNLTHVGSRPALAAGTVPNNIGHLSGWVLDPQSIKPGVKMPQNNLSPDDLKALVAYLEHLK
jgi:cytochrome c oxidase subunit 2